MTWDQLVIDWNLYLRALLRRFPLLDPKALLLAKKQPEELCALLARSHDLTECEAREELENILFSQMSVRKQEAYHLKAELMVPKVSSARQAMAVN